MTYPALTKCFLDALDRYASPRAQIYRTADGWKTVPSQEMLRQIAGLARALGELGIRAGDRVAIFAPNCPAWHVADLAIQGIGAVVVPVYFHESLDRITYILEDSAARVIVTAGEAQARQVAELRGRIHALEQVISAAPPEDLLGEILRYETLIASAGDAEISAYRRQAMDIAPDQLATIIYTSGTTGEPKGVMLTQSNLSSNALDCSRDFEDSPHDIGLSFLPLAHVYGRVMDYSYFLHGTSVAYVEQMENVAQALREVRPTILAAVPRFYEKTYANIIEQGHRETGLRRRIFDWGLRVAANAAPWRAYGRDVPFGVKLRWQLANRTVFSKIRAGMGGRIRALSSGGAPLAPELTEFFWSVGLPVFEGYGLTETSPVVSTNSPLANKVGTVGRLIANVQVRIADDGEILVKGSCVMRGYYRKPDDTQQAFTPEGWFCTGDIGRIDADGYLVITDRKKELLKTAGGKFVAPAPIENLLKTSPYIDNAMIVGDKRKFVSVLIVPDFAVIEAAGQRAGREFTTRTQIASDPWVRDLLSGEIEQLTASLASYERPKRFAVLDQDFTHANGEATYTLKLKRRVIEERYHDVITRLYADVEEPRPQRTA